jgi:hypothetical protein
MVPTRSGSNRWVVELKKFRRTITVRTLVARKRKILIRGKKNTSEEVNGEVCLDRADVVIDEMTMRR